MQVFIPSRGRADNVKTTVPFEHALVVPRAEVRAYRKYHEHVIGCPVKGIAPTRQWIIENAATDDIVFFADDDGTFFERESMETTKLNMSDMPSLIEMWENIEHAFELGYPLVGISYRGGNNHFKVPWKSNQKAFSFWGVDRYVLKQEHIAIDTTPVMEDYYVNLSLLTRGHETRVCYRWCWNQPLSNAPGGCSIWRTPAIHAKGAKMLQAAFPRYVTLVERAPKYGWYDGAPRLDVRVQWQKAYKEGCIARNHELHYNLRNQ
jgi:hypothetical protein